VGFVQPLSEWLKNVIMPLMTKEWIFKTLIFFLNN
jgi:hypothetical protein